MKNLKPVASAAVLGFFLSCAAGFFSGAGISVIFLRALLFSLIFGGLGLGIGYVAEKFLDISGGEGSSFVSEKMPSAPAKTANAVDITIADEALPEDETAPSFAVTNTVKKYNGALDGQYSPDGDVSGNVSFSVETAAAPEAEKKSADTSGGRTAPVVDARVQVPLQEEPSVESQGSAGEKNNFEGFVPDLAAAGAGNDSVETKTDVPVKSSSSNGELDELPDLTELVDIDSQNGAGTVLDTEFASSASVRRGAGRESTIPDIQNTELLAKAISTAIAKDN